MKMNKIEVGNTYEHRIIKRAYDLISTPLKEHYGPSLSCTIGGGATADIVYKKIMKHQITIKDIDVFVSTAEYINQNTLQEILIKHDFKPINKDQYPKSFGTRKPESYLSSLYCTHPQISNLINIIYVYGGFGNRFASFDIANRLAYYDGTGLFAADKCLYAISRNEIILNRIDTPASTAVRMVDFSNRYSWRIPHEEKYAIKLAISDDEDEFKKDIKSYCPSNCVDQVVKTFFN